MTFFGTEFKMMASMAEFKPVKTTKTSDLVVEAVWELLRTGELKPGDKLPSERELAKRFQISITTLREALQKLESYGHITKKRGQYGGSIILDVSRNPELDVVAKKMLLKGFSIDNLNEVLLRIWKTINTTALERATPEQIENLEGILKRQINDFNAHKGSVQGWAFMMEVAKITDNPIMEVIAELITLILMRKEVSLGIDDVGSNEKVHAYNEKCILYSQMVIDAFTKKDITILDQAEVETTLALEEFKTEER